jgi:hypothetical protein
VIQQLNQQNLKADLPQIYDSFLDKNIHLSDYLSTEILSKNDLIQGHQFISYIHSIDQHFHNF